MNSSLDERGARVVVVGHDWHSATTSRVSTSRRTGLDAALNWYRARLINHRDEQTSQIPPFPEHVPALVLPVENELALPPSMAETPVVTKCFPGGTLEDPRYRNKIIGMLADIVEKSFAAEGGSD
ncbi:hypothetical protein JCM1840_005340 [Sporobolomyces johnsonii]